MLRKSTTLGKGIWAAIQYEPNFCDSVMNLVFSFSPLAFWALIRTGALSHLPERTVTFMETIIRPRRKSAGC